ncbi:hypothetical protein Droror1_Dr00000150 [Drosera rotundifolia]
MNATTAWELLQKAYQSANERQKEEEEKKRIDREREKKVKELLFNSYRVAVAREDEKEDEIENDGETKKVDELIGDGNSGDPKKGLYQKLKVREKECSEGDDNKVRKDNEQHSVEQMDSEGKFLDKGKDKVDVAESVNDEHVDEEVEKSAVEEEPLKEEPDEEEPFKEELDEEETEEDPGEEEAFVELGDEEFQGDEEVEVVAEIETNVVAEKPVEDADEDMDDEFQKTSYLITVQGVVDDKGTFTDVCIGWAGSLSDDQVLKKSSPVSRGIVKVENDDDDEVKFLREGIG